MNVPIQLRRDKDDRLRDLLEKMVQIGIMLSAEKNTNQLIEMILEASMAIVGCDAGSIYILERNEEAFSLRFMASRNASRNFEFTETTLPVDQTSIAGYCAYTKKPYIFDNMSEITRLMGIHQNEYFDKQIDYHTTNMMVLPMLDIKDEIIGVLQLINKKSNPDELLNTPEDYKSLITPFTKEEEKLIMSLASQAGMLLERGKLLEAVETLFQNFVETMVLTIDKRDPTTAGHSVRVAELTTAFAHAINATKEKPYDTVSYSQEQIKEIYYAAILHDVGKIGVKEDLLCKRYKLDEARVEKIKYKFLYFKKLLEEKRKLGTITEDEKDLYDNIDTFYDLITDINQKGYLKDEQAQVIKHYGQIQVTDLDGTSIQVLDKCEILNLMIIRGNLSDEERQMMNLHAQYTYDILKDVPWPKGFERIPKISAAHHEKLDGSGYPKNLERGEILFESKMLAIADVFEALTAKDRPYRRGMPIERALSILQEEADLNHLDKDLVHLFIKSEVYNKEGNLLL